MESAVRRPCPLRRTGAIAVVTVAVVALAVIVVATPIVDWAIPFSRNLRMLIAVGPDGPRRHGARDPDAHGLAHAERTGAASGRLGLGDQWRVVGPRATLAIFIAMNWGFRMTLMTAVLHVTS